LSETACPRVRHALIGSAHKAIHRQAKASHSQTAVGNNEAGHQTPLRPLGMVSKISEAQESVGRGKQAFRRQLSDEKSLCRCVSAACADYAKAFRGGGLRHELTTLQTGMRHTCTSCVRFRSACAAHRTGRPFRLFVRSLFYSSRTNTRHTRIL
jgi:hypothetical protein